MRGDRIKAACKVCGKEFWTPYALAEICDWICRSEHMTRKNRIKKGLPPIETVRQRCQWCAEEFFGVPNQEHCSQQCKKEDEEYADH